MVGGGRARAGRSSRPIGWKWANRHRLCGEASVLAQVSGARERTSPGASRTRGPIPWATKRSSVSRPRPCRSVATLGLCPRCARARLPPRTRPRLVGPCRACTRPDGSIPPVCCPLHEVVDRVVQPWWSPRHSSSATCQQQSVRLGDKLMRILARTIARLPDAFAETRRSEIEELSSCRDILPRTAHHAESVPPLVPCRTHDECLIGGPIEPGQLGMANIDEDDAELLEPGTQRKIQLVPHRCGESSVSG